MPVLLPDDLSFPLPKMHRVAQRFPRNTLPDIKAAVETQMAKEEILQKITPGARVAVAVGSRGIRNLPLIVETVIDCIKEAGGIPFVVSAMGSHGSGTEEGQREVLNTYGITEEIMGVSIVTDVEVAHLGETPAGIDVFFDKTALEADLIVPINRVKLHTDFVADIQSGLCKMLVIGLGNHIGCTAMHESDFDVFGETLLDAVEVIFQSRAKVGFGIAILENAYDETEHIEVIPQETLVAREKELVVRARENMPILMIPEIDVLIVQEIGKNISGAGFDPNILGKSFILKEFVLPVPKISKMVLLDLTEETHGNGIGMGLFDIITKKVFDQLDLEPIYANAVAIKFPEDAKIPLIAPSDDHAIRTGIKVLRGVDRDNLKIVKIKNTLELDEIEVSEALLPVVAANDRLALL